MTSHPHENPGRSNGCSAVPKSPSHQQRPILQIPVRKAQKIRLQGPTHRLILRIPGYAEDLGCRRIPCVPHPLQGCRISTTGLLTGRRLKGAVAKSARRRHGPKPASDSRVGLFVGLWGSLERRPCGGCELGTLFAEGHGSCIRSLVRLRILSRILTAHVGASVGNLAATLPNPR